MRDITDSMVHEVIRKARERLGMNQSDLARKLEVSRQTIHYWESGASRPRPTRMREVARVLGIDPVSLLPRGAA